MKLEHQTARRSAWKASLIGAGITAVPVLLPVCYLLVTTSVPGGYAGAAVGAGFALLLMAAIAAVLTGAIAGAVLLRQRRSFLFGLWAIPCAVVCTALLAYGIYEARAHLAGKFQAEPSQTEEATAAAPGSGGS